MNRFRLATYQIILPFTFVGTQSGLVLAVAVSHTVLPVTRVLGAVSPNHGTLTVELIRDPVTLVPATVLVYYLALAFFSVVQKVALVTRTVDVNENTFAEFLGSALDPRTTY